jgi:hypothetical protein
MDTIHLNINDFFEELLQDVKCHQDTKAYIVSIYGKYKSAQFDLSKDSITVLFAQGQDKQNFLTYQTLGDYIFWANTMAPNHLRQASKDYYDTVARVSYYSCYRLINRQWKLFEELADNFLFLERQVKEKLVTLKMHQTSADTYIVPFGF